MLDEIDAGILVVQTNFSLRKILVVQYYAQVYQLYFLRLLKQPPQKNIFLLNNEQMIENIILYIIPVVSSDMSCS